MEFSYESWWILSTQWCYFLRLIDAQVGISKMNAKKDSSWGSKWNWVRPSKSVVPTKRKARNQQVNQLCPCHLVWLATLLSSHLAFFIPFRTISLNRLLSVYIWVISSLNILRAATHHNTPSLPLLYPISHSKGITGWGCGHYLCINQASACLPIHCS